MYIIISLIRTSQSIILLFSDFIFSLVIHCYTIVLLEYGYIPMN